MIELPWEKTLPISMDRLAEYRGRITIGIESMKRSSVVICGLARNNARALPHTISLIEQLGSLFSNYRVVIFENDSADNTLSILKSWQRINSRVTILTEKYRDPVNLPVRCAERATRMAKYRNQYRDYVVQKYPDFDYGIVVDTDLEGGWSLLGVANTFGHLGWDFCGSNGIIRKQFLLRKRQYHYDAWAFRRLRDLNPLKTKYVNHLSWSVGESPVKVSSCFGGLGIYRMQALLKCRYGGGDCEHVALHRAMYEQGMNHLFLNPSQTTFYGEKTQSSKETLRIVSTSLQSQD